jgi:hypothetical protein
MARGVSPVHSLDKLRRLPIKAGKQVFPCTHRDKVPGHAGAGMLWPTTAAGSAAAFISSLWLHGLKFTCFGAMGYRVPKEVREWICRSPLGSAWASEPWSGPMQHPRLYWGAGVRPSTRCC